MCLLVGVIIVAGILLLGSLWSKKITIVSYLGLYYAVIGSVIFLIFNENAVESLNSSFQIFRSNLVEFVTYVENHPYLLVLLIWVVMLSIILALLARNSCMEREKLRALVEEKGSPEELLLSSAKTGDLWSVKNLIETDRFPSTNLLATDEGDRNFIHWACIEGQMKILTYIIERCPGMCPRILHRLARDTDASDEEEMSLSGIFLAARHKQETVVLLLLDYRVKVITNSHAPWDPNVHRMLTCNGLTLLHECARLGLCKALHALIKIHLEPPNRPWHNLTPLHVAGNKEVVATLVSFNGCVNARTMKGYSGAILSNYGGGLNTPLHTASSDGNSDDRDTVVQALIDNGADINPQRANGDTPLHTAAERGDLQQCQVLLDNCADLSIKNEEGLTPLHIACEKAHDHTTISIICLFLKNKADPLIRSNTQQTSIWVYLHNPHLVALSMENYQHSVETVLKNEEIDAKSRENIPASIEHSEEKEFAKLASDDNTRINGVIRDVCKDETKVDEHLVNNGTNLSSGNLSTNCVLKEAKNAPCSVGCSEEKEVGSDLKNDEKLEDRLVETLVDLLEPIHSSEVCLCERLGFVCALFCYELLSFRFEPDEWWTRLFSKSCVTLFNTALTVD